MLTKGKLTSIRTDIEAALLPVANKHGVVFKAGRISYDGSWFRVNLEANEVGTLNQQEIAYDSVRDALGLPPRGTVVEFDSGTYEVWGWNNGVYVYHDGFGIELRANHHEHPTDRIYLEPEVFEALVRFKRTMEGPDA